MKRYNSGKNLTSKEAARLLGASEASVKRWADGGLLPSEKTAGGHRRFRPEDVARFKRENRDSTSGARRRVQDGSADPSAASSHAGAQASSLAREFASSSAPHAEEVSAASVFEALTRGDEEETSALLVKSYLGGRSLAFIFDELLSASMRRVGDLWHRGDLTVAEEHLATRAALDALHTLDKVVAEPEPNDLLAVCCGAEDDFHELPLRCTELVLKHEGWEVLSLGPNTPFYALSEMVVRLHPRLVCVASTILGDLDRAVREFRELRAATTRVGASIVLGGAGFADANVRHRLPAELYAENFQQLFDFAATLHVQSMPDAPTL
ncbi:MAG TPA: B12-binding domain-containing protein [Pyrinomonadaceae bacterium]|nr:B12-binding domain-containing protein [Pyrinomonadaceae bacterium]